MRKQLWQIFKSESSNFQLPSFRMDLSASESSLHVPMFLDFQQVLCRYRKKRRKLRNHHLEIVLFMCKQNRSRRKLTLLLLVLFRQNKLNTTMGLLEISRLLFDPNRGWVFFRIAIWLWCVKEKPSEKHWSKCKMRWLNLNSEGNKLINYIRRTTNLLTRQFWRSFILSNQLNDNEMEIFVAF